MAIFVLGDPHLSFSSDKPMDVFGGLWREHPQKIRAAWLEKVRPEDTVVLAGDLSWAMSLKEAEADLRFFHELPGHKVILKGNHDYWWETVAKMNRFFAERKPLLVRLGTAYFNLQNSSYDLAFAEKKLQITKLPLPSGSGICYLYFTGS